MIEPEKYTIKAAQIIAQTMITMTYQFEQTCSLNKGIEEFTTKGYQAAYEK